MRKRRGKDKSNGRRSAASLFSRRRDCGLVQKEKGISYGRALGYGALGLFGIVGLALLFPIARSDSYATCTPDSSAEECMAMPASTEVGVTTSTVISLALDNQVQMEVVPKSSGTTSYASTKLNVSTNSNDGYAIYLQTGSETGSLTGVTTNLMGEISNTAKNNVTIDKLESNSYGYALSKTEVGSNTTYSHIPTSNTIVESTTSSAASGGGEYAYGDTYYLAFGTKIDTNLPAGQYAGTVTVSAVANPTTLRSMYDLTYMQDMTSDICTNTKEHYTKQLIDTRDGKSYWVAKLKDGNCWMTQNLAFTITQEMIESNSINSTNTDLHPNDPSLTGAGQLYTDEVTGITYWNNNEAVTYRPKATNSVAFEGKPFSGNNTNTWSWNLGEIVLATPTFTKLCSDRVEGDGYASAFSSDNLAEVCGNSGFLDVSKDGWQPGYTVQIGSYTMPNGKVYPTDFTLRENDLGYVAADQNSRTYDAHYLIGNYYQQNAETAGTGGELEDGAYAPSSICPTGWQLPVAGTGVFGEAGNLSSGITRSLTFLLKQYSMAFSDEYSWAVSGNGQYRFLAYPFYNVVSGSIMAYSGTLRLAGSTGYIWSGAKNYETRFDGGSVFASDLAGTSAAAIGASNGMNVRCVAR